MMKYNPDSSKTENIANKTEHFLNLFENPDYCNNCMYRDLGEEIFPIEYIVELADKTILLSDYSNRQVIGFHLTFIDPNYDNVLYEVNTVYKTLTITVDGHTDVKPITDNTNPDTYLEIINS